MDRLSELLSSSCSTPQQDIDEASKMSINLLAASNSSDKPDIISPFLAKVDRIKSDNGRLRNQIKKFNELALEIVQSPVEARSNELESQLDAVMSKARELILEIRVKIGALKAESRQSDSDTISMRNNIHAVLVAQFIDLTKEFRDAQIQHRNRMQDRLIRKIRIIHPGATEEEIMKIIESGEA